MLRGLYTAAAGLITQERKHDTITNNIANLNSTGFKRGYTAVRSFPEVLLSQITDGSDGGSPVRKVGRINTGVLAEESVSVFLQGDMQETGNPFDFAIVSDIQLPGMPFDSSGKYTDPNGNTTFQPQAFFTVADANGNEHYTRNGKFTVGPQLNLLTSNGERVLGSNGQPIVLQDVTGGVTTPVSKISLDPQGQLVKPDGQVLTDANGAPVSLMISRVENPNRLIDEGNSLFRINPADAGQVTRITLDNQVQVRQGYTERSNVDSAQSMVDLTMAMRAYEANQKVIQFYDRSMDKAVNDVGRV